MKAGAPAARRSRHNLPYISPTSPLHIVYISPTSHLQLDGLLLARGRHQLDEGPRGDMGGYGGDAGEIWGRCEGEIGAPARRGAWLGLGLGLGMGLGMG